MKARARSGDVQGAFGPRPALAGPNFRDKRAFTVPQIAEKGGAAVFASAKLSDIKPWPRRRNRDRLLAHFARTFRRTAARWAEPDHVGGAAQRNSRRRRSGDSARLFVVAAKDRRGWLRRARGKKDKRQYKSAEHG
jgi:hypothetical protein